MKLKVAAELWLRNQFDTSIPVVRHAGMVMIVGILVAAASTGLMNR